MQRGATFTNPATNWEIVMQQRVWFCAACVSAWNFFRFSALCRHKLQWRHIRSRLKSVKNLRFTDLTIVKNRLLSNIMSSPETFGMALVQSTARVFDSRSGRYQVVTT